MCGIAGIVAWEGRANKHQVRSMTDALVHRGPDAGAVKCYGNAVLGHRRLRVIDLAAEADQPMCEPNTGISIVFNGEIYNFRDIRSELQQLGIKFKTDSDTEVLLKAFIEWDIDCLPRLVGMFAFAIWDPRENRLILARDRLGKKPLYYFKGGQIIKFASELTALRCGDVRPVSLDRGALSHFLSFNYCPTQSTIVEGASRVPPASFIDFRIGKEPRVEQYWNLAEKFKLKKVEISERQAVEKLGALIDQSVRDRLFSDVPLGVFLSAGIDSATIAESMHRQSGIRGIEAYTMGFSDADFDETVGAEATAADIGIKINQKQHAVCLPDILPQVVAAFDEPFADTSMLPTYSLCKFAREEVTVSLSGDGGDENFCGYPTYVADQLHQKTHAVFQWLTPTLSSLMNTFGPVGLGKVGWDEKLRRFLSAHHLPFPRSHSAWRMVFSEKEKEDLLSASIKKGGEIDAFKFIESEDEKLAGASLLDRAIYIDIKTWLVDDILVKIDRASMAHALEIRSPLLDHRIVEFAASLPDHMKIKALKQKYILRRLAEKRLSGHVINRPKQGFSAPVSRWLLNDLREIGQDITLGAQLSTYLSRKPIETLWRDHLIGKRDNGLKLFGLLCMGLWLDKYAGGSASGV